MGLAGYGREPQGDNIDGLCQTRAAKSPGNRTKQPSPLEGEETPTRSFRTDDFLEAWAMEMTFQTRNSEGKEG